MPVSGLEGSVLRLVTEIAKPEIRKLQKQFEIKEHKPIETSVTHLRKQLEEEKKINNNLTLELNKQFERYDKLKDAFDAQEKAYIKLFEEWQSEITAYVNMLFQKTALLFLCVNLNIANEDNIFLKKFIQHDYEVKDFRVGDITYNPNFVEDISVVYRKYNRTTKALNATILTKVDLTINNTIITLEALKRFDNQYKPFGFRFSNNFCKMIKLNLMGFGTYNCGRLSCPIRKKQRQSYCNWNPDYSQLPPHVPDGYYNIQANVTYQNQFAFNYDFFITVYRRVKMPN
ncbi:hypothetical protein FQR65_LT10713 [Abscondita terminalis]|nr:hypothetical protein FQR65_LT10713 [Abscondita terminalis]